MARRKGKSTSKQDDGWLPLDSPAGQSPKSFNEFVIPGVLLLIIAVGGSGLGWVCSDHQQMIESLSKTLASMQARITQLQQQLGPDSAQLTSVGGFEERLVALEDAYAKAQKQVELALATSEQIMSKDLQNKVWSLQTEMNDKLAELEQNTFSIAALNAIIKNKSAEFEVVKQSVNTMLSANAELAIQIAGFSGTLSVTKLRLDEQISVSDGLMSQLEGQNKEINEIKKLFASNQETLALNTQELMDIKELVESEQIKRTLKLEKQLKSLYNRLEDHQMTTESLHLHLAAQLEALQIQFLPGVQQLSRAKEEVQVEEQVTMSDNKDRKAPEKGLENAKIEKFAEKAEIIEEDRAKENDDFNTEQEAVEEDGASEWPVEKPMNEMQTSLEELDTEIENNVTEEQKEETVEDNVQTSLENSDVEIVEIMDEKMEIPVGEVIEVPDAEVTLLEDFSTTTIDTEEAAEEKQVELTPAQEIQTGSEDTEMLLNKIIEDVTKDNAEKHTVEKKEIDLNEISTAEIKRQEDGNVEFGTAVEETPIRLDEADIVTDVDKQLTDIISDEAKQEAEEGFTVAPAKKTKVSEKSMKVG